MRIMERIATIDDDEIESLNDEGWSVVQVINYKRKYENPTFPDLHIITCLLRKTIY